METMAAIGQTALMVCFSLLVLLPGTACGFTYRSPSGAPDMISLSEQAAGAGRENGSLPDSVNNDPHVGEPVQAGSERKPIRIPSLIEYGKEFPRDLLEGTKRIFSRENERLAVVGLSLTGFAFVFDEDIKDYAQIRQPLGHASHTGDHLGSGLLHAGVGAVVLASGKLTGNLKLADTGAVLLEALATNGLATEALKFSSERLRPNKQDRMSFPSGHVSSTATMAATISEMYDWDLRIAIPLYLTTAFVGASRIQDNMHYLSDVLAGAAVCTIIGTSFAKSQKGKRADEYSLMNRISVSPLFDKDYKGLLFTLKY